MGWNPDTLVDRAAVAPTSCVKVVGCIRRTANPGHDLGVRQPPAVRDARLAGVAWATPIGGLGAAARRSDLRQLSRDTDDLVGWRAIPRRP